MLSIPASAALTRGNRRTRDSDSEVLKQMQMKKPSYLRVLNVRLSMSVAAITRNNSIVNELCSVVRSIHLICHRVVRLPSQLCMCMHTLADTDKSAKHFRVSQKRCIEEFFPARARLSSLTPISGATGSTVAKAARRRPCQHRLLAGKNDFL